MRILLIIAALTNLGCSFDTDCGVNGVCVIEPGKIYGMCVGGTDTRPDPLDGGWDE
jgi:hypothetical protein